MKKALTATGVSFIVLGAVIFIVSLVESASVLRGGVSQISLPGFHELNLKSPGLYAGLIQFDGPGVLPAMDVGKMDVRLLSKDDYREVQVLMNTTGETFTRFGKQGMLLFNFMIDHPGEYTLSGAYLDNPGPTVPVLVLAQSSQGVRQIMIVGGVFLILFVTIGVIVLKKRDRWLEQANGSKRPGSARGSK